MSDEYLPFGTRLDSIEGTNYQSAPDKKRALSVSAAIRITKNMLAEHSFCIEGEVSELSNKPGYKAVYFTIKDEDASLSCLMWKNRYQASGVELSIGSKVQVTGKFSIYAPKGRMNFDVSHLKLAGEGDLRARVAKLAEKLKKEGLMDAARKRSLPRLPHTIGLVTSSRGAAVHDVLRTLRRRYPLARIDFAGAGVEGAHAAQDLIQALNIVAHSDAEVILLVRGGGSFEDLMPFNDEALARAIAACPKPVVTGIGHEPDTCIADMVSDVRASTPTAAAEAVSPHITELFETLQNISSRLHASLVTRIKRSQDYADAIASRPLFKDPSSLYAAEFQLLDALYDRMGRIGATFTDEHTHRVQLMKTKLARIGQTLLDPYSNEASLVTSRLNDLSPLRTLERGWSITRKDDGSIVKSVSHVERGEHVSIQVLDGTLRCCVDQDPRAELSEVVTLEDSHD